MARRRNILIIDGHPDPDRLRFIHALADRYAQGARAAGHEVRILDLCQLGVTSLGSNQEFLSGTPSSTVQACQADLAWAQHVVILFPLWLGDMPGLLKILMEQLLRPGFAFAAAQGKGFPRRLLKGKSARIVVTMGMPALFYRWYYRSHSVKSLERNILGFCGFEPVRSTLVGMVEGMSDAGRKAWLLKIEKLGREAR
jgi:putative NADPH-quinone reductase